MSARPKLAGWAARAVAALDVATHHTARLVPGEQYREVFAVRFACERFIEAEESSRRAVLNACEAFIARPPEVKP